MKLILVGFFLFTFCLQHSVTKASTSVSDLLAAILAAVQEHGVTLPATTTTTTTEATTIPPKMVDNMQLMPGDNMKVVINCRPYCTKRVNRSFVIRSCNGRRDEGICKFCRFTLDCLVGLRPF